MDRLISVGKILNFHGIQGEVRVGYTAGKERQLENIKEFFVEKDSDIIKLTPISVRFHKKIAIIKFKEINSVNEVMEIKGLFLKIPKSVLVSQLDKDEFYIDDLVGLDVYDNQENHIGKVISVDHIRTEDLIVVQTDDEKEHLVPFVKDLVPNVDLENKKVIINDIPGLIEKS